MIHMQYSWSSECSHFASHKSLPTQNDAKSWIKTMNIFAQVCFGLSVQLCNEVWHSLSRGQYYIRKWLLKLPAALQARWQHCSLTDIFQVTDFMDIKSFRNYIYIQLWQKIIEREHCSLLPHFAKSKKTFVAIHCLTLAKSL